MQRLHFIIFLLLIFISFIGLNPGPKVYEKISDPASIFSMSLGGSDVPIVNEWKINTTMALKRECGECHQSSRVDEPIIALEIFDLDQTNWADKTDTEILRALSQRATPDMFSEKEIGDIKNYIDYKLTVQSP